MSNNIENRRDMSQNIDTVLNDIANKKTINDNQPTISASENVKQGMDNQAIFDDLKNTVEGLREGPNLNHELQALISTIISSAAAETAPQPPMQNTSTDTHRIGGVSSVESAGPANSQGASRRLQQILSSDSRFVQQLMDYLDLSSPARKDEHIQNMGREYNKLGHALKDYLPKRTELLEQVKAHIEGAFDKEALRHNIEPLLKYIDPTILVIDNSLKMEEARLLAQTRKNP